MEEIRAIFKQIGKDEIDEFYEDLVFGGFIDSLDIINLVNAIENKFEIEIDLEDITPENFYSFQTIRELICKSQKK
ncbi:acyl carrier protein [Campylobacter aviculae]|uniref:Acyl carrier protein n=1 Tax=Campylobacter aviculae TaxID=2510190 RepID=A0A4U7BTH5_9BACT|nr:acyl carrier protein [Campylobacter aviculae]TKX32204.1 acyl carrier protein [Campylobacter aviculae]